MDQAVGRRIARAERHVQRVDREPGFQMIGDRPADHLAREGVDHHREIDEGLGEPDIGDVGDPDLIEAGRREAARQVGATAKPWRLWWCAERTAWPAG